MVLQPCLGGSLVKSREGHVLSESFFCVGGYVVERYKNRFLRWKKCKIIPDHYKDPYSSTGGIYDSHIFKCWNFRNLLREKKHRKTHIYVYIYIYTWKQAWQWKEEAFEDISRIKHVDVRVLEGSGAVPPLQNWFSLHCVIFMAYLRLLRVWVTHTHTHTLYWWRITFLAHFS